MCVCIISDVRPLPGFADGSCRRTGRIAGTVGAKKCTLLRMFWLIAADFVAIRRAGFVSKVPYGVHRSNSRAGIMPKELA